MASTWSALKIELLETGQNSGTWGTLTNVNLGDAVLGEAITGQATVDFASDADVTITLTDSATTQAARNLRLNITESSTGIGSVRNLILGSGCQIEKFYLINNTGTGAKTVKNTSGTGISVPAGKATLVFNNGTNVVDAASYFSSLTLGAALPVASGGTGLTAGTSGGVLGYTATGTLASSVALTANALVLGAGAGATPTPMASLGTTTTVLHGNASGAPTFGAVSLTADVTGTLPTANGGTNLTSFTSGGVVYASSSSALATGSALVFDGTNLGVGTTSPVSLVTANKGNVTGAGQWASSAIAIANPTNTGSYSQIAFGYTIGTTNASAYMGFISTNQGTNGYGDLVFGTRAVNTDTQPTERLRIDSAGNVGIGTSSPTTKLTVSGSSAIITTDGTTSTGARGLDFVHSGQSYGSLLNYAQTGETALTAGYTGSSGYFLTFKTENVERVRITNAGNVGIGTSSPSFTAGSNGVMISGTAPALRLSSTTVGSGSWEIYADSASSGGLGFYERQNSATMMYITEGGSVGIGTSSPTAKLEVVGKTIVGSTSTDALEVFSNGDTEIGFSYSTKGNIYAKIIGDITNASPLAGAIAFQTATGGTLSERMRIDSAGNLGLGVTPSAWDTTLGSRAIQFTGGSVFNYRDTNFILTQNAYFDGAFKYYASSIAAGYYDMGSGTHKWFIAPSGTAGNAITFTQAMTLSAAGNLGIGVTSPSGNLHVGYEASTGTSVARFEGSRGTADNLDVVIMPFWNVANGVGDKQIATIGVLTGTTSSQTQKGQIYFSTSDGTLTERMRITDAGKVGIGNTAPTGNLHIGNGSTVAEQNLYVQSDAANRPYLRLWGGTTNKLEISIGGTANITTVSATDLVFSTTNTERARIDSGGNFIVGGTTAINSSAGRGNITINGSSNAILNFGVGGVEKGYVYYDGTNISIFNVTNNAIVFGTNATARARIESDGTLLVGKSASSFGTAGIEINVGNNKFCRFTRDGGSLADFNRLTDDGELVGFWQATTQEGNISVSGSTVSYNGGHLSRWAQTTTTKDESIVKGTVLSNLDEMNVYTDSEGNPVDNEQLNKVKVSDTEGDVNVAGVFVNWTHDDAHNVDEINMAMTGDMIIRIAQGVTVVRGDLLMSAGDGTAKPQGDDIVRSKTVAKVTSNHITCTYADGSYCVPCVLMAC